MPPYSHKETQRLEHLRDVRIPPRAQTSRNPLESDTFPAVLDRRGPARAGIWNSMASVGRRGKSSANPLTFQLAVAIFQSCSHPTKRPAAVPALACDCPNAAEPGRRRSRCELRVES